MPRQPSGDWRDAARWLEHHFPERWGDPTVRVLKQLRRQARRIISEYESKRGIPIAQAEAEGDAIAASLLRVLARIEKMIRNQKASSILNIPDEPVRKRPRKKRGKST